MPVSVNLEFPYPPQGAPNPPKSGHLNSPVSGSYIDSKNPYILNTFETKSLVAMSIGSCSANLLKITAAPSSKTPGDIKLTV